MTVGRPLELGTRERTGLDGGLSGFTARGGVNGGDGGDTAVLTLARPGRARLFAVLLAHVGPLLAGEGLGDCRGGLRRGFTPIGPWFAHAS